MNNIVRGLESMKEKRQVYWYQERKALIRLSQNRPCSTATQCLLCHRPLGVRISTLCKWPVLKPKAKLKIRTIRLLLCRISIQKWHLTVSGDVLCSGRACCRGNWSESF
jgi:hypothetical protein